MDISRSESDEEQDSAQQGGFFGHESERVQGMGWMCHRQMYARRAAVRDEDVEGPFADGIEQDGVFQGGPLPLVYVQQTGSIPDEKRPFADGM